jgi:hypothetical protein
MNDLVGQDSEIRMTIEIKRAATGEVETFELVGKTTDIQEVEDGSNS